MKNPELNTYLNKTYPQVKQAKRNFKKIRKKNAKRLIFKT
jgi:hypothetical protein